MSAIFHTGQTGAGAGTRGGGGIRLAYSNPMQLDDVAVDFPDMPIIPAHPSFPSQEEALSVATHKPRSSRRSSFHYAQDPHPERVRVSRWSRPA